MQEIRQPGNELTVAGTPYLPFLHSSLPGFLRGLELLCGAVTVFGSGSAKLGIVPFNRPGSFFFQPGLAFLFIDAARVSGGADSGLVSRRWSDKRSTHEFNKTFNSSLLIFQLAAMHLCNDPKDSIFTDAGGKTG